MKRKLVLNIVFVSLAVGFGLAFSAKPWQIYRLQRKAADTALANMRQAEQERADLSRKKAQYEGALGKEELARNQGYRRADESPLSQ